MSPWPFRHAGRYSLYDVAWDTREMILALHRKVDSMATIETDLQNDLDTIKTDVGIVVDKLTAQSKVIDDLRGQVAAGTPVTQGQLDALKAEADGIVNALAPLVAPAAPPVPGGPATAADGSTGHANAGNAAPATTNQGPF